MPNYNPPTRGQQYVFYVSLVSQSDQKVFQANPTLAAGDVKVSKDGGSLSNLGTLPTVAPASGKLVKVTLSASEMDADNVAVVFSDAAGDEWCDLTIDVQPTGLVIAGTVSDAGPTAGEFDTDLSEATDDHFNGAFIVFTDGVLQGQSRKISDYDGTAKNISVASNFTEAPGNGDPFVILGRSA